MLKCNECKAEISANARSCVKCGTKNQFVGYKLTRKEMISQGVVNWSDFYNYLQRGGKIKYTWIGKTVKVALWLSAIWVALKVIVGE